jgi:MYXO-CTERM domain-containing protein
MTDQELLNNADLAIDGEGLAVACDGPVADYGTYVVSTYLSTIHPTKSYKGGLPSSVTVRGTVTVWTPGPGPVGGWEASPIAEGWIGKMYLEDNNDGTYSQLWWNAFEADPTSAPKPLPSCAVGDAGPDMIVPDAAPPDSAPADGAVDTTPPPDATVDVALDAVADLLPPADTASPDATLDSAAEDAEADEQGVDASSEADAGSSTKSSGCSCQAEPGGPGWLVLILAVAVALTRRLRRPA